jgi:hypothetical protein
MNSGFNSNVFSELGEAIGNIKRKFFPRRTYADDLDASFRRHLLDPYPIILPDKNEEPRKTDVIVIEGVFRGLDKEEE